MNLWNLCCYFLVYSFLGWVLEVIVFTVIDKKTVNRGFFTLPLSPAYGFTMAVLIMIYPEISNDIFFVRYFVAVIVSAIVMYFAGHFVENCSGGHQLWQYQENNVFSGDLRSLLIGLVQGLLFMAIQMVIQPLLEMFVPHIPTVIKAVVCSVLMAALLIDLIMILSVLRRHRGKNEKDRVVSLGEKEKDTLGKRISNGVLKRLDRAYPHWESETGSELPVFAKGMCFYKLAWVFLITSLIGCIVETIFVGITHHVIMSRSSVVFGPFSVVWGLGAVIMTVVLHPLADKGAWKIFIGSFFIGGAFEYACSVFTETFMGTTFWDYSNMPGNIGGRTNILFMIFWGFLGLIWVRFLFPPMSRLVEKFPVIPGTVVTWIILVFFVVDGVLSAGILWRYSDRQEHPNASNAVIEFLDENYPDSFVEKRWQNMTAASDKGDSGGSSDSDSESGSGDSSADILKQMPERSVCVSLTKESVSRLLSTAEIMTQDVSMRFAENFGI